MRFFPKKNSAQSSSDAYLPQDQRERRRKRFYFAAAGVALIFYFVFTATTWLVLKTPIFQVEEIQFVGSKDVPERAVLAVIYSQVIKGSYFRAFMGINNMLIWPERLDDMGLLFLPGVKSVEIEKDYENRMVTVRVVEREPYGIWCIQSRINADDTRINADINIQNPRQSASDQRSSAVRECWWFDSDGIIFKRGIFAKGSSIIVVSDYSQKNIALRAPVLEEQYLAAGFSVFETLKASDLVIEEILLKDLELAEVEALPFRGPKIYFSLKFSAVETLDVIKDFTKKPEFGNLEYLDFRVEKRVYYK